MLLVINKSPVWKITEFSYTHCGNMKNHSVEKREILSRTVWKFHNFYVTQILREINFRDFRGPKYAILTI